MNARGTSLLVALLIVFGVAGPAAGETPRLRAAVVCSATEFQVVDLVAGDLPAEIATRVIGRSPQPGGESLLSRERVERVLASFGWRGTLGGAETVRVSTPGVSLAVDPIAESVSAKLDSLLGERGLTLAGAPRGLPHKILLSCGSIRWSIERIDVGSGRTGQATLEVEDRGGFLSRHTLRFDCSRPARVAVAARDLKPGETITGWELAELDLLEIGAEPLPISALHGAVARHAMRKGQAITRANAKAAPLVRAGKEVSIEVSRGSVRVSLRGVAQADGALGDLVSVRNIDTRELKRYRVTGPGTVGPTYLKTSGR